jgi:hypothetical protein
VGSQMAVGLTGAGTDVEAKRARERQCVSSRWNHSTGINNSLN